MRQVGKDGSTVSVKGNNVDKVNMYRKGSNVSIPGTNSHHVSRSVGYERSQRRDETEDFVAGEERSSHNLEFSHVELSGTYIDIYRGGQVSHELYHKRVN